MFQLQQLNFLLLFIEKLYSGETQTEIAREDRDEQEMIDRPSSKSVILKRRRLQWSVTGRSMRDVGFFRYFPEKITLCYLYSSKLDSM